MNTKHVIVNESVKFSIDLISYYKWLCEIKEFVMSKQLLKSGTSIGANANEAVYAISRADFISKLHISLKEAAETEYWLILLEEAGLLPERFVSLKIKCGTLKRMLIKSLITAKKTELKT